MSGCHLRTSNDRSKSYGSPSRAASENAGNQRSVDRVVDHLRSPSPLRRGKLDGGSARVWGDLGHLADGGGEFEGAALCLIEVSGDQVVRLQVFEPGELASVAERFEELTTIE
jgi:hypothetical protein